MPPKPDSPLAQARSHSYGATSERVSSEFDACKQLAKEAIIDYLAAHKINPAENHSIQISSIRTLISNLSPNKLSLAKDPTIHFALQKDLLHTKRQQAGETLQKAAQLKSWSKDDVAEQQRIIRLQMLLTEDPEGEDPKDGKPYTSRP